MDPSNYKQFPADVYNTRQFLELYFSSKAALVFGEDFLKFPIKSLAKTFSAGRNKGDLLLDISVSATVYQLFSASEHFKDIVVLKMKDGCIMELKSWEAKCTGAFDWGHAEKLHKDIEGKSHQVEDKEVKLRSAMQQVLKFDVEKENMTKPIVLPPADSIISAWLLDAISKDQNDYIKYLRKISKLLKPGGNVILFGSLGMTYYTVGKDKFRGLRYDEEFVRKALKELGFKIIDIMVHKRTAVSDLTDYKAIMCVVAQKEK
ncbi:nicotinamide N-methyltransferase-like [Leptodactylus fuscus]|uniref:nicotinamide N-methyltransferase-like n=1 Tax=Leptodactylus fuscus TaxID=238119 RepID=UPI003F4F25EC